MSNGDGFLSRWSRRKALVREGREAAEAPPGAPGAKVEPPSPPQVETPPAAPIAFETQAPPEIPAEAPPTLEDVAALTPASDFTRFVARDVDPSVKNAALKKLFADPQFNVMDGLDIYIDDYGKPDPLPAGMLRKMAQSQFLGLFTDEKKPARVAGEAAAPADGAAPNDIMEELPDENADLRLQSHDAAEPAEPGAGESGAGEDAAGER
ncbi:DUF3306 domain-containing protein [uncultured Piscinibacter sp.]|uniref:DUF3306 domain-containing protein n=1 Tax=uncultured Piscinibacter sp. TaxID=1131835 RepID=UPI0026302672|nr:DUF3306 domain-containing protein [uncultured Piscinibacter sp.]